MNTMTRLLIFILLAALQKCYCDVPRFFREEAFTCASFAEAVNHLVGLGEKGAVKELSDLAVDGSKDYTNGFSMRARIGFICRVLFEPRGAEPVRPPAYGWLDTLGSMGLPPAFPSSLWTNIRRYWPLYPVAHSGSTYFVLSEGYSFEGIGGPEKPKDYIAYCEQHGVLRKTLLDVPTRAEAMRDAAALRKSKAWKAIKWKDSGEGYSFDESEEYAWRFIQNQAQSIPVR
jgi:hypothetical protein